MIFKEILIAGAGGFIGTAARFLIGRWTGGWWSGPFPLGTFLVNIIGCFLIGLFFGLIERLGLTSGHHNILLITGFCGGFTTFSAFANEMWVMIGRGQWGVLAFYLAASIIMGIGLVWLGRLLVR